MELQKSKKKTETIIERDIEEEVQVIGIIGTRRKYHNRHYQKVEKKFFELYGKGDIICSGGCSKGADSFAQTIAIKHGVSILIHHANWEKYGKIAGFMRNSLIARDSDYLIAMVARDRKGGTEDTIRKFLKKWNLKPSQEKQCPFLHILK
jgi:hypothetical protein